MTRIGEARPLARAVCIHGGGAGGWQWNVWARVLAAHGIACRAPDLQASVAGLEHTHFADYREQVIAWTREDDDDGVPQALIGASLGGLLALSIAGATRAAAVVVVNPMPPAGVVGKPLGTPYPPIVRWGSDRSISGTRRSLVDADDATRLFAFRRWRDESGAVLEQARLGIAVELPRCPTLVLASELDDDVPPLASRALAVRCAADYQRLDGCSHVGPLLGVDAAAIAARASRWIIDRVATAPQSAAS